jgi:MoxR-like ATPase
LDVSAVEAVATPAQAVALQEACARVTVDDRVVAYAVRLARATRSWAGLRYGAGPRGGLAMVRAARAVALLEGRDFVTPDDIKSIAPPALRHRVALSPELELEGMHADDVLRGILDAVEAPRQ